MSKLLLALRQWAENIKPGGRWYYGGSAGRWYLYLVNDRSPSYVGIGICPEELADLVRDAEEAPQLRTRVAELERMTRESKEEMK